jgi:hypothetical protein
MGTGTDSTDIKEEAKKRSHVMAKLYRGILDILRIKHDTLSGSIITHIRSFDRAAIDNDMTYAESMGYWRMVVELIFQVYVQISLFVGIVLVVVLVALAWPLRFLIEIFSGSWFLSRERFHYDPIQPTLDPIVPEEPQDKKSDVVRRVVYEEAKVSKK